jgi:hypothetical protein
MVMGISLSKSAGAFMKRKVSSWMDKTKLKTQRPVHSPTSQGKGGQQFAKKRFNIWKKVGGQHDEEAGNESCE